MADMTELIKIAASTKKAVEKEPKEDLVDMAVERLKYQADEDGYVDSWSIEEAFQDAVEWALDIHSFDEDEADLVQWLAAQEGHLLELGGLTKVGRLRSTNDSQAFSPKESVKSDLRKVAEYVRKLGQTTLGDAIEELDLESSTYSGAVDEALVPFGQKYDPYNELTIKELVDDHLSPDERAALVKAIEVATGVKVAQEDEAYMKVCTEPFEYRGVNVYARDNGMGLCQWEAEVELSNGVPVTIGDPEGGELGRSRIEQLIDKLLDDPRKFLTGRDKQWILGGFQYSEDVEEYLEGL